MNSKYQVDASKVLPLGPDPLWQDRGRQFLRRQVVQRRNVVEEESRFAEISRRLPLEHRLDRLRRRRRPRLRRQAVAVSLGLRPQQRPLPMQRRHRHRQRRLRQRPGRDVGGQESTPVWARAYRHRVKKSGSLSIRLDLPIGTYTQLPYAVVSWAFYLVLFNRLALFEQGHF